MEPARRRDWRIRPLPDDHVTVDLSLEFDEAAFEAIRCGLVPMAMEDKWFLFYEEGRLYCHRSWTGICVYEVEFEETGDGGARAVRMRANAGYTSDDVQSPDEEHRRGVEELIRVVLLGGTVDAFEGDDEALDKWAKYGRAATRESGSPPGFDVTNEERDP